MSRMEDDLRAALRREEPDQGFTERVLARVAADQRPHQGWRSRLADLFRVPAVRYGTAAALCATLVVGVGYEQERRTRAQGEEARQKLMLALQITSSKLELTRDRLRAISDRQ